MFTGGSGLSLLEGCLIGEALSFGCSGVTLAILGNGLAEAPVIFAGNEEQKKEYLGRMCKDPLVAVNYTFLLCHSSRNFLVSGRPKLSFPPPPPPPLPKRRNLGLINLSFPRSPQKMLGAEVCVGMTSIQSI